MNQNIIHARISLISNYDCLAPQWSLPVYSFGGTPLPGLCHTLSLNPKLLKMQLDSRGIPTVGRWPDVPSREGNELVSYEEIAAVIDHCPNYAGWTFFGTMDRRLIESPRAGSLAGAIIPEGTLCTLFNEWDGGGSLYKTKTIRDIPLVELRKRQKKYKDMMNIVSEEDEKKYCYSSFNVYHEWLSEEPLVKMKDGDYRNVDQLAVNEAVYSVFYKNGDEANDFFLTWDEALSLAEELEEDGYEVTVAKHLPDGGWETIHETV